MKVSLLWASLWCQQVLFGTYASLSIELHFLLCSVTLYPLEHVDYSSFFSVGTTFLVFVYFSLPPGDIDFITSVYFTLLFLCTIHRLLAMQCNVFGILFS